MTTAAYYQAKLDDVNTAISALETGTQETELADGRRVRRQGIEALYAERARLEANLNRVSRTGLSISRGAAL